MHGTWRTTVRVRACRQLSPSGPRPVKRADECRCFCIEPSGDPSGNPKLDPPWSPDRLRWPRPRLRGILQARVLGSGVALESCRMVRKFFAHYRRDLAVVALVLAGVGAYFLYEHMVPGAEQRLRSVAKRMLHAAARADSTAFLLDLAPDYSHDGVGRAKLKRMLDAYFKVYGPTTIKLLSWKTNIRGQIALAEARILTQATNKVDLGGQGAESLWRLSFSKTADAWQIDRIAPVLIMGQQVSGFDFRDELRQAAEEALEKADLDQEAAKARARIARQARLKVLQKQRTKLLERCPPNQRRWLLDDFEKGQPEWVSQEWSHPAKISVEKYRGSRRLKAIVLRTDKDKAAIERPIDLDFSSRDEVVVDVDNLTDGDVRLALALHVQTKRKGQYEWYESAARTVRKGINENVTFSLRAKDYKSSATAWKHVTRARDLDGVVRLYLLIYTVRPGVFYFDNVMAIRKRRAKPRTKVNEPGLDEIGKDIPQPEVPRSPKRAARKPRPKPPQDVDEPADFQPRAEPRRPRSPKARKVTAPAGKPSAK